jgi:ABC-2 type transport system ATP-binding protein
MHAIEITSLTKRFGDVTAVDDLSFTVDAGTVTGFLGPNGAGKTTTLRALLGLVRPDAGTATIAGRPYRTLERPALTVGAVLDTSGAHPARAASDHLLVAATAAGIDRRRIGEVLELVGLAGSARRRAGGFSQGMRQRLQLATALLGDPDVLVLDEPTNGLDPSGVRWLRTLIRDRAAQGRAVLVSSHLLAEVAHTVDHVIVIDRGRLVRSAPLAELAGPPAVAVRTPAASTLADALAAAGIEVAPGGAGSLVARRTTPEAVGRIAAAAGVAVYELRVEPNSLEEAFLALTGAPLPPTADGDPRHDTEEDRWTA